MECVAMTLPVYPRGDLDNADKMLSVLGSYWATRFPDNEVLNTLYTGRSLLFEQTNINTDEVKDIVSRYDCPDYHNELWSPMYFRRNSSSDEALTPLRYGADRALYGEASNRVPFNRVFEYGQSLVEGNDSAFALPSNVVNIRIMCNRVDNPSLFLVEGVDFKVDPDNNVIAFSIDLFNDPRVATRDVIDSTTGEADSEAILWAFSADIDKRYMWEQFGYVVNIDDDIKKNYKDFINAVWDMHTGAPTTDGLTRALSAAWDVPLAKEDEIVEVILTSDDKAQIITDKNVYDINPASNILVAVGDVLEKYDRLVDTFEIIESKYIDDGLTLKRRMPVINTYTMTADGTASITTQASGGLTVLEYPNISPSTPTVLLGGFAQLWDPFLLTAVGNKIVYRDYGDTREDLDTAIIYQMPVGSENIIHGPYTNQVVTVTRNALAEHTSVQLKFKLLIIGPAWVGNDDSDLVWTLKVDGTTYVSTNFSNSSLSTQAYPGNIGTSNAAATAGETWNSAYIYKTGFTSAAVAYTLEFAIPHNTPSIAVEFSCAGLNGTDSVCVVDPTPLDSGDDISRWYRESGEWVEVKPSLNPRVGLYTPSEIAYLQTIDTFDYGSDLDRNAWDDIIYGSLANSAGFSYNHFFQRDAVGNTIETGRLTYPSACWGITDMTVKTINSDISDLPEFPPQIVNNPDVRGITLGRRFLSDNYFSTLYFPNKEVPLEYLGPDSDGRVEVRFEINGYPGDVEQYWEDLHARGKSTGYVLANYLDQRDNPIDDPSENDLPSTVNPMLLVLRHLMSYNLIIIKMKTGLEGSKALDAKVLDALRDIIPPQTSYIIFMDIQVGDEDIDAPLSEELVAADGPLLIDTIGAALTEDAPAAAAVKGAFIRKQL